MEWGDVLTIGLVLVALWVFVGERLTPYRLEDGVRLAADAVRAVARRVAPLVRWLAYDVIVGRKVSSDMEEDAPHVLSSSEPSSIQIPTDRLRQTVPQTDEPPPKSKATEAEYLTLFAVFKEAGYNRDEARRILRPHGVPVDNNLFSRAPKAETHPQGEDGVMVPAYEAPPR